MWAAMLARRSTTPPLPRAKRLTSSLEMYLMRSLSTYDGSAEHPFSLEAASRR